MRKLWFCTVMALLAMAGAFPQSATPAPDWHLMDLQKDGYRGISLERAYREILNNKKPVATVVVAILDDGLDDTHPDLAGMEWTNTKEIAGNNTDDDHNGYADDLHGWNFIGGMTNETVEAVREYARLRKDYEGKKDTSFFTASPGFVYWDKMVAAKNSAVGQMRSESMIDNMAANSILLVQKYWTKRLGKDSVYVADIKEQKPDASAGASVIGAHNMVMRNIQRNGTGDSITLSSLAESFRERKTQVDEDLYNANTVIERGDGAYFRKKQLGDDPYTDNMKNYGDPNTFPLSAAFSHGTECAGIIAALRNNGLGGNGITNSVKLMPIRICASEDADEWDKDLAHAIRYAADNGARVINMSFAKTISPQKNRVDDAIRYAEKKGVLLVVAAGNQATDNDSLTMYTSPFFADGTRASNIIKVGASGCDSALVAPYSCYGRTTVDVFAPGSQITTTAVSNSYKIVSGTSFSAPIVTGLCALIWSYYPHLSYSQVRTCIEGSAIPIGTMVIRPGTREKVPFSSLSRTGGIVNGYRALVMAAAMPDGDQ